MSAIAIVKSVQNKQLKIENEKLNQEYIIKKNIFRNEKELIQMLQISTDQFQQGKKQSLEKFKQNFESDMNYLRKKHG